MVVSEGYRDVLAQYRDVIAPENAYKPIEKMCLEELQFSTCEFISDEGLCLEGDVMLEMNSYVECYRS